MRSTTTIAAVALVAYVAPSTAAPIRINGPIRVGGPKPLGVPVAGLGPVRLPFSEEIPLPTLSDSDTTPPPLATGGLPHGVSIDLPTQESELDGPGPVEARKLKLPTISPEIKKIAKVGSEVAGAVGTGIGILKSFGHGDSSDDSDGSNGSADASASPSASAPAAAASAATDSGDTASRRALEERSIKIPAGLKPSIKAIPKIIGGIGTGISVCQIFGHCNGGSGGSSSGDTTVAVSAAAAGVSATEAADTVASTTAAADAAAATVSSDSVSRRQLEERFKISPKVKQAGQKAGQIAGTAGTLLDLCQTFGGCGANKDNSGSGDTTVSAAEAPATEAADTAATTAVSAAAASATAADSSASTTKRAIRRAIRRELVDALLARELDELD